WRRPQDRRLHAAVRLRPADPAGGQRRAARRPTPAPGTSHSPRPRDGTETVAPDQSGQPLRHACTALPPREGTLPAEEPEVRRVPAGPDVSLRPTPRAPPRADQDRCEGQPAATAEGAGALRVGGGVEGGGARSDAVAARLLCASHYRTC